MTNNKIVYLVYVGFIHIFLNQFLMDGLVNVLPLEVYHLFVCLGKLDACVRHDYCISGLGKISCVSVMMDGFHLSM